jgi:hypothetical protein
MTFRCSELALELGEPLPATAPFAPRWDLVEREKPWGRDHGITQPNAKVLLVHRAGSTAPGQGRRYLVCTNGARDQCCARLGPAVVHAVERARPGQAYECSHLGGHRFAANLLILPDGLCFGRLDVPSALHLLEELEAGRLPLQHFRGRTAFTREQQAAEILVRRELRIEQLGGLRLVDGTTFVFDDGRRVTARVQSEPLQPRRVSCRDDKQESPLAWSLLGYDVSD